MRGYFIKAIKIILTVICIMTSFNLSGTVVSAAETDSGKIIHVVYDDSRSMYEENRWVQAKYALEVFGAMLGENDVMKVYCLNSNNVLTVKGSDAKRVNQIHQMNSTYSGTPFRKLLEAGDALVNTKGNKEKWLVVLTDGVFDNDSYTAKIPISTVQAAIDKYNSSGIKTVFLGIGSDAAHLQDKPENDSYAYVAGNSSEILYSVTTIANQIFEHMVLPDRHISGTGTTRVLNIDIPTNEIVLFAQGENVSVGSLYYNGREIRADETLEVKHSGDVLPNNPEDKALIHVDESLHGIVVIYKSGTIPFESGNYSVDINGEKTVEYYYRPGVDVVCELYQNGDKVPAGTVGIASGTYQVKMNFVRKGTEDDVITSDLLKGAEFNMVAFNNGTEQTINSSEGSITLGKGEVSLNATARLPGNVILKSNRSYSVLQALNVEIVGNPGTYTQDQLVTSDPNPIVVKITDKDSGEVLTDINPNNIEFTVEDSNGTSSDLTWQYYKNDDNTWSLVPKSSDGTLKNIQPGQRIISINAKYQEGNRSGAGNTSVTLTIKEYICSPLILEMEVPQEYKLTEFLKGEPIVVTAYYTNPETGTQDLITEHMWKKMSYDHSATRENGKKGNVQWKIKRGDKVGQYYINPKCFGPFGLLFFMTTDGEHNVMFTGSTSEGEYIYKGSITKPVNIVPLPLWIKILCWGVLVAVIYFIIGEIRKPRIPRRLWNKRWRPQCIKYRGREKIMATAVKVKIHNVIFPVFKPETAVIHTYNSRYGCYSGTLKIQASSRDDFTILSSIDSLKSQDRGKITKVKPRLSERKGAKNFHKRVFRYESFSISSHNSGGQLTGKFLFYKLKQNKRK